MTPDGEHVFYTVSGEGIVEGQSGEARGDIVRWSRSDGSVVLVTSELGSPDTPARAQVLSLTVSANGRFVAFSAATESSLVEGVPADGFHHLYLTDLEAGTTELISHSFDDPSAPVTGFQPLISADGRFIAFSSFSEDLVESQVETIGGDIDIFLHDRATGATELVSHAAGSTSQASGSSFGLQKLSGDGRFVVFESSAPDVVSVGADLQSALFVYDRLDASNTLIGGAEPEELEVAEIDSMSVDGNDIFWKKGRSLHRFDRYRGLSETLLTVDGPGAGTFLEGGRLGRTTARRGNHRRSRRQRLQRAHRRVCCRERGVHRR